MDADILGSGDAPCAEGAVFTESEVASLSAAVTSLKGEGGRPSACLLVRSKEDGGNGPVTAHPLVNWSDIAAAAGADAIMTVCVADPSSDPARFGWPIRNLFVLLAHQFGNGAELKVNVVAFRETARMGETSVSESMHFSVTLAPIAPVDPSKGLAHFKGLEKDGKSKLKPRLCNLSASMDPKRLAESAVGLNLSLMRWRLLPVIDLPKIAATKCLLIGSGTLGCNVARLLLGWGVKKITFVDSGKVSYSNPVRQTLFTFEDCLDGGQPKALAAAKRLKEIYPGVDTEGHVISIPMPGHGVSPNACVSGHACDCLFFFPPWELCFGALF